MASHVRSTIYWAALGIPAMLVISGSPAWGQQKRARPPEYPQDAFRGVFFEDVSEAIRGERPRVGTLSATPSPSANRSGNAPASASPGPAGGAESGWGRLIDPVHLEDEVKRLKLRYDELVTTPSRFRSGGFQDARQTLSVLAMLMAVIADYGDRVRFQNDAAVARDLFARSAKRVTEGSEATFDEAKQRKADMQDMVSGTGLNRADPAGPTDWSLVGARIPLMNYLEQLLGEPLQSGTNDAAALEQAKEEVDRAAALVAVVGEVLKHEDMDDGDDEDYRQLSEAMQQAALEVRAAIADNDAERARAAVGKLGQSCSVCHEQYR